MIEQRNHALNSLPKSSLGNPWGAIPEQSTRIAKVADIPDQAESNAVKISTSTKTLTYVNTIEEIDCGEIVRVVEERGQIFLQG